MTSISTTDVQTELEDACRRVALDDATRAKLVDVVTTNYIDLKDSESKLEAVQAALEADDTEQILSNYNIWDVTISEDDTLTINLHRNFPGRDFNPDIIFNGQMCILGRTASKIAELAMDGNRVALINAEEIVVTGGENQIINKYSTRQNLGSDRGPFYPKRPDKIVKRSIRGMLPHKQASGRKAFERIQVYIGTPEEFEGNTKVPENKRVSMNPSKSKDFVQIGRVSEALGAEKRW
jgi:large subunit ribosomal protein L13